ncbi:MAG: sigma-54-dependent Fis family transcriptional regulator [Myxococcales bacterium]|nr:sigma-54-dependent Fis family transcriptional regulator [Myxococcales bacterium]
MSELDVLIVEDDEDFRASVAALLRREGYATREAGSLDAARSELEQSAPDVVLLDLQLPDGDGLSLLGEEDTAARSEFVVMTGNADVDSAVSALRVGALDYLPKPVDRARLKSVLTNVARTRGLKGEISELRGELRKIGRFGAMVGRSKPMQQVYDLVARVAPTDSTVFVTGESGTGKELVAETVHRLSRRKQKPFLALNCGAVSATLIESELFGHEKGSFTGADRRRSGFFEEADGGTLFLDEITEMPIELQVKLLRVLETGKLTRVGATASTPVDVRIVAASNRDPREAVAEGMLREDLLYRLNVFPIHLPPLRERGEDVALLAGVFLDAVNERESTSKRLSEAALAELPKLPWPGNVRELKNGIERAAILSDGLIGPDLLPAADGAHPRTTGPDEPGTSKLEMSVGSSIAEVERRLILATLEELQGDKKRAAELLGISLKTLYNRLNVYEAAGQD